MAGYRLLSCRTMEVLRNLAIGNSARGQGTLLVISMQIFRLIQSLAGEWDSSDHRVEQGRRRPKTVAPAKRRKSGTSSWWCIPGCKSLPSAGARLSLTRYCSCYEEIILEKEARELFRMYVNSQLTFAQLLIRLTASFTAAPLFTVFDANTDTYEALHDRSPFAVNCIVWCRQSQGRWR